MQEHEVWITRLFNDHLAGVGNSILGLFRVQAENPARPWVNFITMEILVALIMIVLFALLRPRLSMDKPGTLQQSFEMVYQFISGQAEESVDRHPHRYVAFFSTLFVFILFCNLIGVIPGFESPTMFPSVTAGCALASFLYFNLHGVKEKGPIGYLKSFAGPSPLMAPLMFPIEVVSTLARPLSLTIRLYANMLAGEKVTVVFLGLTYLIAPAAFMGLHVFVSFLQAYVFALLTMIYVNGAVSHEH
jgi:F-type H+-transporting ATPase subunit a